ncbi:MAG: leucine--tRNA ligase, partial [Saprospiraceae bacterium]
MDFKPNSYESKWREQWQEKEVYKVHNNSDLPKYYVLDMFPYPSGSGLHVGHPLGYIASDIFARYKRLKGFNVLHPMGFDSFGLPAEQYAIQTGIHPAKSTAENMKRYREQLDLLGFSFDWSRKVSTADPSYYKWTQWIFTQLFDHYFDKEANAAKPISELKAKFAVGGSKGVTAAHSLEAHFSADEWNAMSAKEQADTLMAFRLAYRKVGYVNWCEELGTVLANDQVKDGVSERGGYPVEQRPMTQWYLRITAYAQRMLDDLETIDWSEALKTIQSNWIGRSEGASVFFDVVDSDEKIEVFTTRPDTIFGATYMVLAPEHDLVAQLTTDEQRAAVDKYIAYVNSKSEVDRQAEKEVTCEFIGAYATNPFTNTQIPIWIGEYVLKDYGTGAIMAVPSDDDRDKLFATKFGLEIIDVVDKSDYPGATLSDKIGKIINSDFLDGMEVKDAITEVCKRVNEMGVGESKINYKLRDANFGRQRYWGEPFPVVYDQNGMAHVLPVESLPVTLPDVEDFQPKKGDRSPLQRAGSWMNLEDGYTRETDVMPAVAGSSWYFLRYMDPHNDNAFASQDAVNYWRDVDLYVGGAEHAVAHLMYARFWHKFLFDKGLVPTVEPFKRLVNQGMIQGTITYLHRAIFVTDANAKAEYTKEDFTSGAYPTVWVNAGTANKTPFVHAEQGNGYLCIAPKGTEYAKTKTPLPYVREIGDEKAKGFYLYQTDLENLDPSVDSNAAYLQQQFLQLASMADWQKDENGDKRILLSFEIGKMSKSKYNVINPDELVAQYGADCFRMYEMFLGPVEQSKPWDTNGMDGVYKFLRKFWQLFHNEEGKWIVSDGEPTKTELKSLHACIKKVNEDIERFSFNTCVSAFMVVTNELRKAKCHKREVVAALVPLIAPFAPYVAEELWSKLGMEGSVHQSQFPVHNDKFLV